VFFAFRLCLPEIHLFFEESSMSQALQVATTTANKSDAERIARALVERRLAACVQVSGPITSTYRWQDAIETATEWLCTIKTTEANYDRVEATIRQLHTYDEPEIIALPIVAGSATYLDWLRDQVNHR
jgi:periplasmic divalent cation tolerance protein